MNIYAKANPDRLRKAVDALGKAVSDAENAHNSRKEVKRAALRLAVGAENLSQTPTVSRDCVTSLVGGEGGIRTNGRELPLHRFSKPAP